MRRNRQKWENIFLVDATHLTSDLSACPFPETHTSNFGCPTTIRPTSISKPVSITVTESDYRKFFRKKWTELTSTSPSRKHLAWPLVATKPCDLSALNKNHHSSFWLTQSAHWTPTPTMQAMLHWRMDTCLWLIKADCLDHDREEAWTLFYWKSYKQSISSK